MKRALSTFLCILLVWLCPHASHSQPIELPKGLPALREKGETSSSPNFIPTNPFLVNKGDFEPLGLNLQSELLSPDYLARASEIGFGAYRLVINEGDFAELDSPNYLKLSSIIDTISKSNAEVLLVLETNYLNPSFYTAFFNRVYQATKGKVHSFQLLDTINLRAGASLKDYSETVTIVRSLREKEGADYEIVCGSIQGVDRAFLSELKDTYILDRVDALAFNLYPTASSMEIPSSVGSLAPHSIYEAGMLFQELLSLKKRIYVTELGVSSALSPGGVSQPDQASILSRSAILLLNAGATRVFFSALFDTDPMGIIPAHSMGILMADGTPKPAFYALKNLADLMRGSYFIVPYYLFQMSNEFPADSDPVFVVHLYSPTKRQLKFLYWTSVMNSFERYTNLIIYRPQLEPTALSNLLTGPYANFSFRRGGNILVFSRIPLSHIPTAITFQAEVPRS